MTTKPQGKNRRAMLTEQAVRGMEKVLAHVQLPAVVAVDPDVQSALRYLSKTIENFNSPEAEAKRQKVREAKQEWLQKRKEESK